MLRKSKLAASLLAATMLCAGGVAAQTSGGYTPISVEAFARVSNLASVTMSPDGKHLAALSSPDGERVVVSIWDLDDLSKPPYLVGSHPKVRFTRIQFIKNDRLFVNTIQMFDQSGQKGHLPRASLMDLQGKEVEILANRGGGARGSEIDKIAEKFASVSLISDLPADPDHIIAQSVSPYGASDIFRINVRTGKEQRILRTGEQYGSYRVDGKGEPRARQYVDVVGGVAYFVQQIRHPDTGAWEDHFRIGGADRSSISLAGFTADPNIVLIASNKGADHTGIYEYDVRAKKVLEPVFAHRAFDAVGVEQDKDLNIVGVSLMADRPSTYWTDPRLADLDKQLRAALGVSMREAQWSPAKGGQAMKVSLPNGAAISIVSWTDDFRRVLVRRSGPDLPPEYILLADGKPIRLGGSVAGVDPKTLGHTELVQYRARDGLMIPAFLTTPPEAQFGKGPHPAIILPHGGPWARDVADWDSSGWVQYFASRGYVILQPQFRGSEGWGQTLWTAGDREWGQKMQDDKDDGAKWLIEQKIAAPDRIAVHGYSYGGYAAFAAAIRPNGLYQCAIAGAGVAELGTFQRDTFEQRFLRDYQSPTIRGLSPLEVAETAQIPMLIYHGDRDTTVPVSQSTRFAAKLKAAGKPHKYVELADMGHQSVTWLPVHTRTVLTTIEDYLKNDCGPGGL